jgi:hypothetical protein
VFDRAVDPNVCSKLDKAAALLGGGHVLFDRQAKPRSPLEQVISQCLHRASDTTRYAEYWWRDEWMNLDVHRDADEVLARTEKKLRW